MRLYDYKLSPVSSRRKWFETFKITSGMGYFGGKQLIGKYLMNRLLNMAVRMETDGKKPDIFIDAFTGGGKIGLSIPQGWFDTIVINDLDYGVVSYFQCCKNRHRQLIKMIEAIGNGMGETMFQYCAYNRCNSSKKAIQNMKVGCRYPECVSNKETDQLIAGAMTYWVVEADFNGCTSPDKVSYKLSIQDKKENNRNHTHEKEAIRNIIEYAKKRIPKIHDIMEKGNIIIESLDYKELIKKYNGKAYINAEGEEIAGDAWLGEKNKLWYFDPPYHPATLSSGNNAPYMKTFSKKMVQEMTDILHNDKKGDFGEIEYFIKSDYNPKYTYEQFYDALKEAQNSGDKTHIEKFKKQAAESKKAYHDFDKLEENDRHSQNYKKGKDEKVEYYVECIGDFGKGSVDNTGEKTTGREYIWCRGNYQGEESPDWKYNGNEKI